MAVGAAPADIVIRLFGGISASANGRVAELGGPRPRSILARLAWDSSQLVTVDQLVDDIWGEHPPPRVRAALQVHVSRLRTSLASIDERPTIVTRAAGYVLQLPAAAVDVLVFGEIAGSARRDAAWTSQEVDEARRALLMWSGRPFAGLESVPFVEPLVAWLEGRRTDLVVMAAHGARTPDDARRLLPAVERIASGRPLDEAAWSSWARLLVTAGQRRDALNRLADLRANLRHQAGLDAGRDVDALEQWILGDQRDVAARVDDHRPSSPQTRPRATDRALVEQALRTCRTLTVCGPIGVDVATIVRDLEPEGGSAPTVVGSERRPPDLACAAARRADAPASDDAVLALLVDDVPPGQARALAGELRASWTGRLVVAATGPVGVPGERVVRLGLLPVSAAVARLHDLVQIGRGRAAHPSEHALLERIAEATDGVDLAVDVAGSRLARRRADRVLAEIASTADYLEGPVTAALDELSATELRIVDTMSRLEGWFDALDAQRVLPRPRRSLADVDEAIEQLVDAGLVAFDPARPEPYLVPRPIAIAVRARVGRQDADAVRELVRVLAARSVRAAACVATEREAEAVSWFERRHDVLEGLAARPDASLVHRRAIVRSLVHTSLAGGRIGIARDLLASTGTQLGHRDLLAVATVAAASDEYDVVDECVELAGPPTAPDRFTFDLTLRHVRALRHRCRFADAHQRLDLAAALVSGDDSSTALIQLERGMILAMEARTGEARRLLASARGTFARLGVERAVGGCWVYEAWCDLADGQARRAAPALERSRAIASALDHRADVAFTDVLLARHSLLSRDAETAAMLAAAALEVLRAGGDRLGAARALEVLSDATADDHRGRRYAAEADWLRAQIGAPQSPLEHAVAAAT